MFAWWHNILWTNWSCWQRVADPLHFWAKQSWGWQKYLFNWVQYIFSNLSVPKLLQCSISHHIFSDQMQKICSGPESHIKPLLSVLQKVSKLYKTNQFNICCISISNYYHLKFFVQNTVCVVWQMRKSVRANQGNDVMLVHSAMKYDKDVAISQTIKAHLEHHHVLASKYSDCVSVLAKANEFEVYSGSNISHRMCHSEYCSQPVDFYMKRDFCVYFTDKKPKRLSMLLKVLPSFYAMGLIIIYFSSPYISDSWVETTIVVSGVFYHTKNFQNPPSNIETYNTHLDTHFSGMLYQIKWKKWILYYSNDMLSCWTSLYKLWKFMLQTTNWKIISW